MKNANLSRLGGFTLIELLVVVLIIGILAAMAMPQYFKAVERSRMTEAVAIMDSVAKAQRRKYMQRNTFTSNFEALDVAPKGAKGENYYTKGDPETGRGGNGFQINLYPINLGSFRAAQVSATRVVDADSNDSSLQYKYSLSRYYMNDNVSCIGSNQAGQELCADFCGIDTPTRWCCDDGNGAGCNAPADNF
ncbi:MAG: prepilin-type N-terminal cleavage/methylation domain-containing protein [Spirochaetota bacterium]|uniref:type IV pilin protein n=1 Tax=Candidatus Avelusimicrobium faecicola TaxID=3416205 RepID=UPI002A5B8314|nr:prepilin-type N-terminal cleavage/methylation domain-containing protein [Spirochaetota bacterium]